MEVRYNKNQVLRYLGYKANNGKPPQDLMDKIEDLYQNVIRKHQLYNVHRKFELDKSDENSYYLLETNLVIKSSNVIEHLEESNCCMLIAVCFDQKLDRIIQKMEITNFHDSILLDFIASSVIEAYQDAIVEEINKEVRKKGEFLTEPFSPGYGNWGIEVQKNICDILDTKRKIGLYTNENNILLPRKAQTAIVGVANKAQKMRIRGCAYCNLVKNCLYRKRGVTCEDDYK